MQELHTMETSVLLDLLVSKTNEYIKMVHEGCRKDEFTRCSLTIRAIQAEIDARHQTELPGKTD